MMGGGDIWKAHGTVAARIILTPGSLSSLLGSVFGHLGGNLVVALPGLFILPQCDGQESKPAWYGCRGGPSQKH